MTPFVFCNPTKVIFGPHAHRQIVGEIAGDGYRRVLLVYGRGSVERSGVLDEITDLLASSGIRSVAFGGVRPNPVLSHTREGIVLARAQAVDAVLAVGGGSVLDEAKAIAAGVCHDGDVWDFFERRAAVAAALPVYTVLTLAATGSEANGNSVVTNEEGAKKYNIVSPFLFPKASALNPALTMTLGDDYMAYSAVDAISHVIEGYFTKENGNPLIDRLCESIVATVIESTDAILKDGGDYEARAQFMWASSLALNGSVQIGLDKFSFPNHIIELPLSAHFDLAHGAGLSIVIPAWMRWYKERNRPQFERFSRVIFGLDGADAGIDALEAWFRTIGAPVRLSDVGIGADALPMLAASANDLARLRGGLEKVYTVDAVTDILKGAL